LINHFRDEIEDRIQAQISGKTTRAVAAK
jgi:NADH-quinone oxidoreductase subunit F